MGLFSKAQKKITKKAKIISILNQKGGVGKTTMTFNLANALALKQKKVLCIDMDPQANLSLLMNGAQQAKPQIFQLLLNSIRQLKALHRPLLTSQAIISTGLENRILDFIPAGQDLSGFELTIAGISSPRQLVLKGLLEKSGVIEEYDYILIDGPPTLGLLVVNILCASDGVLVPFQPDLFSKNGLEHFHEVVADIEEMGIVETPQVIGYIPNLVDPRRKQAKLDFQSIEGDLGQVKIFDSFANKVQLVKAQARGKSVFDFNAKEYHPLQESFFLMAEAVMAFKEDT